MFGDYDHLCKGCWKKYFKSFKCERKQNLNIMWLPENFSQSKFTKNSKGSNACTLIVLLLSKQIETLTRQSEDIGFDKNINMMDSELLYVLAESILQGNLLHEHLLAQKTLHHNNLSVPEAIKAGGRDLQFLQEWNSFLYLQDMDSSLYNELREKLSECMASVPVGNIYVVLIALNRSILLVVEREEEGRITLLDSHQHVPYGSVIVQTQPQNLQSLCSWYCGQLRHRCSMYELSFMYFPRYLSI